MTCTWYAMPPACAYAPTGSRVPVWLRRAARRVAVGLGGGLAVAAGLVMLVLPGPGLVTIALGFGVLGREFAWAARVNGRVRARLERVGRLLTDH